MSQMIEVKTAELSGTALDWAVAKAIGWTMARVPSDTDGQNSGEVLAPPDFNSDFKFPQRGAVPAGFFLRRWSSDWSQGGPLFSKYLIEFVVEHEDVICAVLCDGYGMQVSEFRCGETHLIATCRAIVAAKLGDAVSVPAELAGGA